MFYKKLFAYGNKIALIQCDTGDMISYAELEVQSNEESIKFGSKKELVFIEVTNSLNSIVSYIGALKSNKVVYLLEDLHSDKSKQLIELYNPQIIVDKTGSFTRVHSLDISLHKDLLLLLSTSGSTGTPKFVKLSGKNIESNAEAISTYLQLTNKDVALSHLSLHYSYGLSVLHSHLFSGSTIALTSFGVLDNEFWELINKYKATSFAGVPYTFESLYKKGINFSKYDSLRYITQAGGKLEPDLVRYFSKEGSKYGFDFFVMYGQTEAAPRISYLPPSLCVDFANSIGKAIPGGELFIVDEYNAKITQINTPGELVYKGDNVMMGYAQHPMELSSDDTPNALYTGDIACQTENGLFYIVGRSKRFVKIFGLRINLDDVQSYVKTKIKNSAVAGTDDAIFIAIERSENQNIKELIQSLSNQYNLPKKIFMVHVFDALPLLPSGKYDYKAIIEQDTCNSGFWTNLKRKVIDILELGDNQWDNVQSLFEETLQLANIDPDSCFDDLEVDSISFVFLLIELEEVFESELPMNWQKLKISELEDLFNKKSLN